MSVEALCISSLVEDGVSTLRTFYSNGVTNDDFPIYAEEFDWIEKRIARRKTLNWRIFRQRFPDFDKTLPKESAKDLALELREERAYEEVNALVATLAETLERDNALELAVGAKDEIARITRTHSPMSDAVLEEWVDDVQEMRRLMRLAKAGTPIGLKTGFDHLDHHWGGLIPGQTIQILGRTGEGKSLKVTAIGLAAKLQGANVGIFTPELSKHEVKCRLHTLASARPEIQKACDLKRSFRNRALLFRQGFNLKSYQSFCEYFATLPGKTYLLSGQHRREKMSVGYIEDKIVEYGLDLVIVDPIYLLKPVRMYKENKTAEIGDTAEALEVLAETYSIPLIFTNQANRQGGAQGDAPHKDRSYNSDVPNHVSDYILGVKHMSDENRMICRCTKSRFGQEFRYEVDLYANTGVIRERTPLSGNYYNGNHEVEEDELKEMVATAIEGSDNE